MRAPSILLLIALIGGACGTQREVVQEGRFQKRTHQHGWHIDLHGRHEEAQRQRAWTRPMQVRDPLMCNPLPEPDDRLIASTSTLILPPPMRSDRVHAMPGLPNIAPQSASEWSGSPQREEERTPHRKWNALAIAAFAVALVAIGLGFSQNLWLLVAAVVITLVLAGFAIHGIRQEEQAGKGFAIAALTIGVIAALLTTISIVRFGTDQ